MSKRSGSLGLLFMLFIVLVVSIICVNLLSVSDFSNIMKTESFGKAVLKNSFNKMLSGLSAIYNIIGEKIGLVKQPVEVNVFVTFMEIVLFVSCVWIILEILSFIFNINIGIQILLILLFIVVGAVISNFIAPLEPKVAISEDPLLNQTVAPQVNITNNNSSNSSQVYFDSLKVTIG